MGYLADDEPDNEVQAALDAVSDAMNTANLSDEALFADDADGEIMARRIRKTIPEPVGLSPKASRLYRTALDQSCRYLVQVVLQLPSFEPRALAAALGKLSVVSSQLAEVLSRTPRTTLDAPEGTDLDGEFRRRYLKLVATAYDKLELVGVSVRNFRPRTTLSVAYLALSVDSEGTVKTGTPEWFGGSGKRRSIGAVRVESALATSSRVLLRGEAGSGKTTLLGWIVVNAARAGFTGELAKWNNRVPFVIKLRRFAGGPLPQPDDFLQNAEVPGTGPVPPGWIHRTLQSGEALLLVDGVDELPAKQRPGVRRWLENLLNSYSHIPVVVTSRPGAVNAKWLAVEKFTSVNLERMTPDDVRTFLKRWHVALLDAAKESELPFSQEEVERHRRELLAQLNARSDLRALASNPLVCSMLCALHLDRGSNLPKDRAGLYTAVMELLLDRRDADRSIPAGGEVRLDYKHKLSLLQTIAWWLTLNGRSELPRGRAHDLIDRQLAIMPTCSEAAEPALAYLLERSGLIREPVDGRVDFVHKTFLEFLAAREAMEEDHIDLLVNWAHTDLRRETVVMAAGLLNRPQRTELITGLLDRADQSRDRTSRALKLVAARCRESLRDLPSEVLSRLDECIKTLVPPRNVKESRSLATVGESILTMLPEKVVGLTTAQARACVQTATLTNGPSAVAKLAGYVEDGRPQVQEALIESWQYFDPEIYANSILANAALVDGEISLRGAAAEGVYVQQLHKLKQTQQLTLRTGGVVDCSTLRFHLPLRRLNIDAYRIENVAVLSGMTTLEMLALRSVEGFSELAFLPDSNFISLSIGELKDVTDYSVFQTFSNLSELVISGCRRLDDLGDLGVLERLAHLRVVGFGARKLPSRICDQFPMVEKLALENSDLTDVSPLVGMSLQFLRLRGTLVRDLSPLADISTLTTLEIRDVEPGVDLTPLMDSNLAELRLDNVRDVYGLDSLPAAVRVTAIGSSFQM